MEHQEYPKYMAHPAYEPGSVGEEVRSPSGFSYFRGGTPVRLPPIVVHSEDDEAYYAAKGYVSQAVSDPMAFMRAHAVAPAKTNYSPAEYPKWVGNVLVQSEDEELALLESDTKAEVKSEPSQVKSGRLRRDMAA